MKSKTSYSPVLDSFARLVVGVILCLAAGWPVVQHPRGRVIGLVGDAHIFSWGLEYATYWPTTASHPLFTRLFYPFSGGVNLASNTFVPFIGILFAPVTHLFGVQVSYNAAMLGSLGLSFFLVSHLSNQIFKIGLARSLAIGLLFSLSSAQVAGLLGHLHLAMLGFAFLLFVRGAQIMDGSTSPTIFVSASWLAFVQALISSEMLLITVVLVVACALVGQRKKVFGTGIACLATLKTFSNLNKALFVVPLLLTACFGYFAVRGPQAFSGVHQPPNVFVTDFASSVVPTHLSMLTGRPPRSLPFTGNASEWYSFVGVFTIAYLVLHRKALWATALGRRCVHLTCISAFLALGPSLHVWGFDLRIPMPWAVVQNLPIFSSVVPARFSIFTVLGVVSCFTVLLAADTTKVGMSPSKPWVDHRVGLVVALLSMSSRLPLTSSSMPDRAYRTLAANLVQWCPSAAGSVGVVGSESPYLALGLQARGKNQFLLENGFAFRKSGAQGVLDLSSAISSPMGPASRCILSLDGPLKLESPWVSVPVNLGFLYVRNNSGDESRPNV